MRLPPSYMGLLSLEVFICEVTPLLYGLSSLYDTGLVCYAVNTLDPVPPEDGEDDGDVCDLIKADYKWHPLQDTW